MSVLPPKELMTPPLVAMVSVGELQMIHVTPRSKVLPLLDLLLQHHIRG